MDVLHCGLECIQFEFKSRGWTLNGGDNKTAAMAFANGVGKVKMCNAIVAAGYKINVSGLVVPIARQYQHLGGKICDDLIMGPEVKQRGNKSNGA
eukprot:481152-Karenia_brevis.AAC.1